MLVQVASMIYFIYFSPDNKRRFVHYVRQSKGPFGRVAELGSAPHRFQHQPAAGAIGHAVERCPFYMSGLRFCLRSI